jgi:hypothetical protein
MKGMIKNTIRDDQYDDPSHIGHKVVSIRFVDAVSNQLGDPNHLLFPQDIPLMTLWLMYDGIQRVGVISAGAFVRYGFYLAGRRKINQEQQDGILALLAGIADLAGTNAYADNTQESLLAFTYALLQGKELTYAEAAEFASFILEYLITADAWRLRVTRWATEHRLPIPEVKRGRPRKTDINS